MIPKTTSEMDINPKDQKDILECIENMENIDIRNKLIDDMSTKAVLFCADIVKAFNKFME